MFPFAHDVKATGYAGRLCPWPSQRLFKLSVPETLKAQLS
jgi:hypothetical protein